MNKIKLTSHMLTSGLKGMLAVVALTIPMWLIGRSVLGEAVISLLYLAPIAWSASKWGQPSGMSAALTAALCFDFLFIPPFYTFAIVVVGRIQDSLSKAHEATFMYELSSALSSVRTADAVAHTLARYIRQLFQASQVNVTFQQSKQVPLIAVSEASIDVMERHPDRVLPILNAWGLVGEIQIWRGEFTNLPEEESFLLQNFAFQAARAFERTHNLNLEQSAVGLSQKLG